MNVLTLSEKMNAIEEAGTILRRLLSQTNTMTVRTEASDLIDRIQIVVDERVYVRVYWQPDGDGRNTVDDLSIEQVLTLIGGM